MKKTFVILGPTASGKSGLAVQLAKKFNGEIISADSRQVYKGLNIGTGKITHKEMRGVKHYLLDVANPKKRFTVLDFKKLAEKAIADILSRNKLPIICGGTGFYIESVVDGIVLPEVAPNQKLRPQLAKKNPEELSKILRKVDTRRWQEIDKKNSRRMIRAIEIAKILGEVPQIDKQKNNIEFLQIGIKTDDKKLRQKISIRLFARIREGMIGEAKRLHRNGLSWKRMEELGLEYRYSAKYLKRFPRLSASSLGVSAMAAELETAIWHYAQRQKTWFRRDKRIKWFQLKEKKKIEKEVRRFLK